MNVININNLKVTLNNFSSSYCANDAFTGFIDFQFIFPKSVKYIYIDLVGKCTTSLEKNGNAQSKLAYTGEQVFVQFRLNLLGDPNARSAENIPAGTYNYPFSFQLPSNIPPSVKENYGLIEYFMKVVLLKADHSSEETKVPFTVTGPKIDLRDISDLYLQHISQVQAKLGKFCCMVGNITLSASISKRAFKPGDKIRLEIDCENDSSRKIESINAFLYKNVTYRFGSPSNWETTKTLHLHSAHHGLIDKHSEKNFTLEMIVPLSVQPLDLTNCRVMEISYNISVKANVIGPFVHPQLTIPIEIGDIVQDVDVPQGARVLDDPPAYSNFGQNSSGAGDVYNFKASAPMVQ